MFFGFIRSVKEIRDQFEALERVQREIASRLHVLEHQNDLTQEKKDVVHLAERLNVLEPRVRNVDAQWATNFQELGARIADSNRALEKTNLKVRQINNKVDEIKNVGLANLMEALDRNYDKLAKGLQQLHRNVQKKFNEMKPVAKKKAVAKAKKKATAKRKAKKK